MEEELLAKNDLKQTKRRKAVLAVLEAAGTPLSAEEIYGKVVTQVHMSVSTTYRILGVLTEKGLLLKSLSQDGKTYYQLSGTKHKHLYPVRREHPHRWLPSPPAGGGALETDGVCDHGAQFGIFRHLSPLCQRDEGVLKGLRKHLLRKPFSYKERNFTKGQMCFTLIKERM